MKLNFFFINLIMFFSMILNSTSHVNVNYSTINFPHDQAYINTNKPTIVGTLLGHNKDAIIGEVVEIFINGNKVGSAVSDNYGIYKFFTENGMSDGNYEIEIFCVESQVSLGPHRIVIDTTPPSITILCPNEGEQIGTNFINVSGMTEENSMVVTFLDNDSYGNSCYADELGNWSIDYMVDNGSHAIKAQATDIAGNIGPICQDRNFSVNA